MKAGRLAVRGALAGATLLLATAALYTAIRIVPGTPWADDLATPRGRIEEWSRRHHLDRGFAEGYARWLGAAALGDLGESWAVAPGRRVGSLIAAAAPTSLLLGTLGFTLALAGSVAAGLASARRPGGFFDSGRSALFYLLQAAPAFWTAMLLQDLFAVRLGWLPLFGPGPLPEAGAPEPGLLARIPYWVLPSICLAMGSLAFLFRFTRAALLDEMTRVHLRAARARGIAEPILRRRHALAGAGVHFATLAGLVVPSLLGGSVVLETIFGLPGIGRLFFLAVSARDYPIVMGVGLVLAVVTIAASALSDLLQELADPRLRRAPGGPR